jgi:ribosomal protein S18 acetylase RimI-like enzyme
MSDTKNNLTIEVASLEDAPGVHKALLSNLVEIRDLDELKKEEKDDLEEHGFLRKEEPVDYYEKLIKDEDVDVYIAKESSGEIIAFGSIHKRKFAIANFRSTLDNLYADDENVKTLLNDESTQFAYLDQISVFKEHQRQGIGSLIMQKMLDDLDIPVVSFVVKIPLANNSSVRWHDRNGFDMAATCDGAYKGKNFEWWIYIHWNKK